MDIRLKNGGDLKIMITKNDYLYEYYIGGRKIGVYSENSMRENILILENTLSNELSNQIRDEINSIDKNVIKEEAEETRNVQKYAEEIGIQKVRDIYTIDIPKNKDKIKGEDSDITKEESDLNKDEVSRVNQEQSIKTTDVNIKQAIDLSERANDLHDMKKWLGGNIPPKFTKLVVIDSDDISQMKDENGKRYKRNSTRYDLALVDKNGNVEPLRKYIPMLQQRTAVGNNPTAGKYQVDKDGRVEKDPILSEYEIGEKIIQIDNKQHGRVQVNIGREEHSGNKTIGTQVRDSNSVYTINRDIRAVIGEYERNGERTVDKNIEEIECHEKQEPKCQEGHTYEDIDGELDTTSHGYVTEEYVIDENGDKYTYSELATKWGLYADGKPDKEDAKKFVQEKRKEDPDKSIKDIIDEGEEEYEDPRAPDCH